PRRQRSLEPAARMALPTKKPPAPRRPSMGELWRRTFSKGIRQAIFEGFVFLFIIICIYSLLFYVLGVLRGFDFFDDRIQVAFGRLAAQHPDMPATSLSDYQIASQWVRGNSDVLNFGIGAFWDLKLVLFSLPLLLLLLAVLMSQRITRSIRNLTEVARAIEAAEYNYPLVVQEEDEIGDLAMAMEHMRRQIQSSQQALEQANTRLAEQLREQQYALQQARLIQANFMPLHYKVKNCTVASLFLPQAELSGDFFTFKELRGDRVAFLFGDIQGHGVPASLNMMSIVTSFRLLAEEYDDPGQLAGALNMLCGHNAMRGPMPLVTAVVGVIDPQEGVVLCVNAGHPSPLLVDTSEKSVREIAQRDPILGLMPDYRYSATRVILQPDDKILLYTDGLVECVNAQNENFERYFHETVTQQAFNTAEQFIEILRRRIEEFSGEHPQSDDILLSCITVEVAHWQAITLPPANRENAIAEIVSACARLQVPNEVTSDIHLALDELITNALVHGNAGDPAKQVLVRYSIGHGVVRVAVKDEGGGFTPDLDEYHLTGEQLMERGRRGIYLVKSLMDEMLYNEAGNEVTVVKRYLNGAGSFGEIPRYDLF
ncbi:MAG TPA: SpoIIE family protein phosphatase, partial [bacterium]|nr:SpoIIE family protein phosphatase [bacterium]